MRAAASARSSAAGSTVEELEHLLTVARARVRQLGAAVDAEEGSLVHASLSEAEETAVAARRPGHEAGARPTGQRLSAQVAQSEENLRKEHEKFRALFNDGDVRLALAVEQGVDSYHADVRTLRRLGNPAHGGVPHARAQASTNLRNLDAERQRLAEAVRSLTEEQKALADEARVAAQSKQTLVDALRRRDAMRAKGVHKKHPL